MCDIFTPETTAAPYTLVWRGDWVPAACRVAAGTALVKLKVTLTPLPATLNITALCGDEPAQFPGQGQRRFVGQGAAHQAQADDGHTGLFQGKIRFENPPPHSIKRSCPQLRPMT